MYTEPIEEYECGDVNFKVLNRSDPRHKYFLRVGKVAGLYLDDDQLADVAEILTAYIEEQTKDVD